MNIIKSKKSKIDMDKISYVFTYWFPSIINLLGGDKISLMADCFVGPRR